MIMMTSLTYGPPLLERSHAGGAVVGCVRAPPGGRATGT